MQTDFVHTDMFQLVSFSLGTQRFAIDILKVQEIDNMKDITSIPNTLPYVAGAINLWGKVISVLNLRKKFDMEKNVNTDKEKIIIVDIKGTLTGIIVDAVSDVLRIPADSIESPPQVSERLRSGLIRGIAKQQAGLILILDMDKLLDSDEHAILVNMKQAA